MLNFSLTNVLALAATLRVAVAQSSIPKSLTAGFSSALQLQASFTNDPSEGFADGTKFKQTDTTANPTFALGDASGVNTAISFCILLVDTTCPNSFALHFAQTSFKADGDKTQLGANGQAAYAYAAPGSFGEKGLRQYSFLMYSQPSDTFTFKGLPQKGATFDINAFESTNGLKDAKAGTSFSVDLGGSTGCGGNGGGQSSPASSAAASVTSPPPASSAAPVQTPPTAPSPAPVSSPVVPSPSPPSAPAPVVPPPAQTSAAVSQVSSSAVGTQGSASSASVLPSEITPSTVATLVSSLIVAPSTSPLNVPATSQSAIGSSRASATASAASATRASATSSTGAAAFTGGAAPMVIGRKEVVFGFGVAVALLI